MMREGGERQEPLPYGIVRSSACIAGHSQRFAGAAPNRAGNQKPPEGGNPSGGF